MLSHPGPFIQDACIALCMFLLWVNLVVRDFWATGGIFSQCCLCVMKVRSIKIALNLTSCTYARKLKVCGAPPLPPQRAKLSLSNIN